jgi:hypothetical protein
MRSSVIGVVTGRGAWNSEILSVEGALGFGVCWLID